jgi:hypothetical protein
VISAAADKDGGAGSILLDSGLIVLQEFNSSDIGYMMSMDNGGCYVQYYAGGGVQKRTFTATGSQYNNSSSFKVNGYLSCGNDFTCGGTKSRLVKTKDYDDRLLYCYEMPSPIFGDVGEGIIDDNGECLIDLDDIFSETVITSIEYQVFLQKEGQGNVWVEQKEQRYFIVKGTPNLKFAWEIKARQKDYPMERLDDYDNREDMINSLNNNYDIMSVYYNEEHYIDEMEGLYETA